MLIVGMGKEDKKWVFKKVWGNIGGNWKGEKEINEF